MTRYVFLLLLLGGCAWWRYGADADLVQSLEETCARGNVLSCIELGRFHLARPKTEQAAGEAAMERACRLGEEDAVRSQPAVDQFTQGWKYPAQESDAVCAWLLKRQPARFNAAEREGIHRRACLDARYLGGARGHPVNLEACRALAGEAHARGDAEAEDAARRQLAAWGEAGPPAGPGGP